MCSVLPEGSLVGSRVGGTEGTTKGIEMREKKLISSTMSINTINVVDVSI